MKITRQVFLVAVASWLLLGTAQAGFISGNVLARMMNAYDTEDFVVNKQTAAAYNDSVSFVAYVIGVFDATEYLYSGIAGMRSNQAAAIVSKYLKNHPEKWNESGCTLVINALKEAFPKVK